MTKKIAKIIVGTLKTSGVKYCYGIVGDTINLFVHIMHLQNQDFTEFSPLWHGALFSPWGAEWVGP